MRCAKVQDRLLLYSAGDLSSLERAKIRIHLLRCVCCAAVAEDLSNVEETVHRAVCTSVTAPPGFQQRVMSAVFALPIRLTWRERLQQPIVWNRRLAVACALIFLMAGGIAYGNWRASNVVPDEHCSVGPPTIDLMGARILHASNLTGCDPVVVSGNEPVSVAQRLTHLVGFYVYPVDLSASNAVLAQGRKWASGGVPLAVMQYTWGSKRVSLFQVQAGVLKVPRMRAVTYRSRPFLVDTDAGLACVLWHAGKSDFVLVAAASTADLLAMAAGATGLPTSPSDCALR